MNTPRRAVIVAARAADLARRAVWQAEDVGRASDAELRDHGDVVVVADVVSAEEAERLQRTIGMRLGRACPDLDDCKVPAGTPHRPRCQIARCTWTGRPRALCKPPPRAHDCGQDIWTGTWPEFDAARRLGELARWTRAPSRGGVGWQACSADDPDALPNPDYLAADGWWDRAQQRWVLPALHGR